MSKFLVDDQVRVNKQEGVIIDTRPSLYEYEGTVYVIKFSDGSVVERTEKGISPISLSSTLAHKIASRFNLDTAEVEEVIREYGL